MAGLAFLMGHAAPEPERAGQPVASGRAMTEAWALSEKAQSLTEARQSVAALASWQRAYELSSDPTLLLEVARLEREVGNAARATHAFELFLTQGDGRVSEQRKQFAARQMQVGAAGTSHLNLQTNVFGASIDLQ